MTKKDDPIEAFEEIKFQLDIAITKTNDISKKVDRNLLYQTILIFTSVLIIFNPVDFVNIKFSFILDLDTKYVISIIPFLLFFLFSKLGLYLKRYIDLREYLEDKSESLSEFGLRDEILLFSNNSASEFFYYLKKYPDRKIPNIVNRKIEYNDNYIGAISIKVYSYMIAILIGLNISLTIWIIANYLNRISFILSLLLIFAIVMIMVYEFKDFLMTTKDKILKRVVWRIIYVAVVSLIIFIFFRLIVGDKTVSVLEIKETDKLKVSSQKDSIEESNRPILQITRKEVEVKQVD